LRLAESITIRTNRKLSAGVVLCLALSLAGPLRAESPAHSDKKASQEHYGLVFGTVWSPKDEPVAGVRVKIRRENEKKARWELYSNRLGEFEQLLPAGSYVVWADVKRPKRAKKRDQGNPWSPPQAKVQVENDIRVDIGLHLTE